MPKRIPAKLPQVTGDGPVAQGFRLSFDRINEILDYLESLQPRPGAGELFEHTDTGITRQGQKNATGTEDETDSEARWA